MKETDQSRVDGVPSDRPIRSTASSNEPVRLFIPLRAEFYEAFARGEKQDELRRYGPRWNERTCAVGRRVVLSRGYGKAQRLTGRIGKFKKQHGTTFGSSYKASIERIYGTLDLNIACIGIELDPRLCPYDQQQCEQPGCRDPQSARFDPTCVSAREKGVSDV